MITDHKNEFKTFHNFKGKMTEIDYVYENGYFKQPVLYYCDLCQVTDLDKQYIDDHYKTADHNSKVNELIESLKKSIDETNDKIKQANDQLNNINDKLNHEAHVNNGYKWFIDQLYKDICKFLNININESIH